MDSILDEIDKVLESNAEDFVRSFMQAEGRRHDHPVDASMRCRSSTAAPGVVRTPASNVST